MTESKQTVFRDVIIIGAGWSGLVACKCMLEEELTTVALEKRSDVGGLWNYSDDPDIITVMTNTKTTSSSSVTEMSDFPMPEEIGQFPKHEDVLRYLKSYCDAFDLWSHIRFDHCAIEVRKEDEFWQVRCENGQQFESKYLIVCTGSVQKPNRDLEQLVLLDFVGEVRHSSELKSFLPEHANKRVMLIGGGETASDVVEEYYDHVSRIIWCIPRGMHFFRKFAKILPHRRPQALDKASSRVMKSIAPYTKSKPGLSWICNWTTNGSLLAYQGHGIAEWKNDAKFFRFFINKNGHVLDKVDYQRCVPKGAIKSIKGKRIIFCDGTEEEVDVIIQCTGYKTEFPLLPLKFQSVPLTHNYKFIFNVDDPTLAFVGYVRPVVGSISGMAEIQSRFVGKVFSGKCDLPPRDQRLQVAVKDKDFWDDYFKDSSRRLGTLVEAYTYIDDIGSLCGIKPDYCKLFWRNPRGWRLAVFAPYDGCSFRLNEPDKEEWALQHLRVQMTDTLGPSHLLLIIVLRLIWFDYWLHLLGEIKYRIQRTGWWKTMREWQLVRALDWCWQAPKRWLFDQTTRA